MLAPIDKITNRGNDIIQLVITRTCDKQCSNCTQLLPFRRDVREMSLECVEEALVATANWPGVIACFGGNPCTHSRFADVCKLFQKHIPDQSRRGLWTNNLLRHGDIAKETFWPKGRFNLNVHGSDEAAAAMQEHLPGIEIFGRKTSEHGGMLHHYADYGYTYEQWAAKREKCPINQNWSAGIYQGADGHPYAYFCEVAGSLSAIRGEDNGLRVTLDWWKRPMADFQDQVRTCCDRGCGVPLNLKGHLDNEATYDISPTFVPLTLNPIGKPVTVEVCEAEPGHTHELTDYAGLRKKRK